MGIKTEDFVKNLPPKELTEGIDWLGILEAFDPTVLEQKYINECARRNPYVTCYKWDEDGIAPEPIEGRLKSSKTYLSFVRRDLENCVVRIRKEGLTPTVYKLTRTTLIKAIGEKGAEEYNRREYERLGEEGRKRQAEEYARWSQAWEKKRQAEEEEYKEAIESGAYWYWEPEPASMHEKIVKIRKGVLGSNGKPLTQRDFAKYIGYPINKYVEAEKLDRRGRRRRNGETESAVEFELLEKLIMICRTNPYWLFDDDNETDYAEYDMNGIAGMGDAPCVFATPDIILRWIKEGKPRVTHWESGIPDSSGGWSI